MCFSLSQQSKSRGEDGTKHRGLFKSQLKGQLKAQIPLFCATEQLSLPHPERVLEVSTLRSSKERVFGQRVQGLVEVRGITLKKELSDSLQTEQ